MKKLLKEKILLEEPEDAISIDEIPVPSVEEKTRMNNNLITNFINDEIRLTYDTIGRLKSEIATLETEVPEKKEIIDIFNSLLDENTVHIGMLQTALSMIDGKSSDLIDLGKQEAEDIASETSNDLNRGE